MIREDLRESRQLLAVMDKDLEKMLKSAPATEVFYFDVKRNLRVFKTIINGIKVYFMQSNCLHSARCYYMSDELAAVLGFSDAQRLRRVLNIRRARRFISVDGLRRRINVYATRSMDLQPLPEYIRKRARRRKN